MKKIITLTVCLFGMMAGFAQSITKITTQNDVSFIVDNGKEIKQYVLQTEEFKSLPSIKVEKMNERVRLSFEQEKLVIRDQDNIYVYTTLKDIKGENVVHGYGLSKRYGDVFVMNNLDELMKDKEVADITSFDFLTLKNSNQSSRR